MFLLLFVVNLVTDPIRLNINARPSVAAAIIYISSIFATELGDLCCNCQLTCGAYMTMISKFLET